MFSYLNGNLVEKTCDMAIIDINGIGYRLFIPYSTYQALPDIGNITKLHTYLAVREDSLTLFGFLTTEEKRVFGLLISVSGVGPKLALSVLSNISVAEFGLAVITDDVTRLTKISGVGKKTAQRLVIELKDKIKQETIDNISEGPTTIRPVVSKDVEEAINALQVLGYTNKDATRMVERVYAKDMSLEDIVKKALKGLK